LASRTKAWASGFAAAGVAFALAGCGPRVKTDVLSNDRASALCAAMETAAKIKDLVFQRAVKQTPASNRLALAQLAKQSTVRIEAPLLDSYDDDAKQTKCSGQLHVTLPPGAVRNLGDTSDLTAAIKYSAQPTPDHFSTDYQVTGADDLISGIAGADITEWASKLQPNGMPAEGAPIPVGTPAPESAAPQSAPSTVAAAPATSVFSVARPLAVAKHPPTASLPPSAAAAPYGPALLARCRWARSYADRTICGDPALEAEDRRIQRLYRNALAEDSTGEVRRIAQSELGAREGCQDRDCIEEWFKQREADLSPR
jgi:hypothetical protein